MSEATTLQENLTQNGYAPVPIDLDKSDLDDAVTKYIAFLELEPTYRQATVFELTDRGDGDFGQHKRAAGQLAVRGALTDNKDIFHFGSMTRQVVEARLAGEMPQPLAEFLDAAEHIYWAAQRTKRNALEQLDVNGVGLAETMQPATATINDVLRFIAYYPNQGSLAKGHFDRSVTTLAIGESHPGLRMAPSQNGLRINVDESYLEGLESQLRPVEHHPGEAKFFLGAGWNRLPADLRRGQEDLPLAYHDVVQTGLKVGQKVMRWAIVMFSNPPLDFENYAVPSPAETRPHKQLGRLSIS